MTTYAEKADIAAKAVKVLDSVTMKRHEKSAIAYADLAYRGITGLKREKLIHWTLRPENEQLVLQINDAQKIMKDRLEKPRYTMKDGEWVRKWPEQCRGVGLKAGSGRDHYMMAQKEANALRDRQFAAMAQNMGMGAPSFGGGNPYVGLSRFPGGIGGPY